MAHSTPPRGARLRHDLLRIAIASSLCVPAGAMGQELLDEIVVTARFREENLQQTPLAITAFTGEMLESRGATSTLDLDAFVPNAVIAPLGAGWGSTAWTYLPALIRLRAGYRHGWRAAILPLAGLRISMAR